MSKSNTIAIASDHAGFKLKQDLINYLNNQYQILDLGTDSETSVDYPDYAQKLSQAILKQKANRGILICGSGVGMVIAANRFPGIRAGLCHDEYSATQGVEHDHMNVLVLGARVVNFEQAKKLVSKFLEAKASQEEKYLRRISKIDNGMQA